MAIFLTADSKILVQGITGGEGRKHGARMLAAGAQVVGGTNPKKAGTTLELNGAQVPVFATVAETMAATGADVSVIFVPAAGTKSAVMEAIDAEIPLAIVITEGVPVHDTAEFWAYACEKGNKTRIVGPNCPGIDIDALAAFEADPDTKAIVMIGEIGGDAEERAAAFIDQHVTKPVVGYVAGFMAPEGKTMGHAGAIISAGQEGSTGEGRRARRQDPLGDRGARARGHQGALTPAGCSSSAQILGPRRFAAGA
jgi:succinyl-CoA synthetase alpha subunit